MHDSGKGQSTTMCPYTGSCLMQLAQVMMVMGILNGKIIKRTLLVGALCLMALLPLFSGTAKSVKTQEVLSYFTTTSVEENDDYCKITYTFREKESYVMASQNGIEIEAFKYLSNEEISYIMAESWYIDRNGYGVSNRKTAETVTEAIRRYLDETYPYTGAVTAEKANAVFQEMVSISICPYQSYGVRYFEVTNGLIGAEVDYFDAKYSFGTKIAYTNRLVEYFGVGMSVGTNLTFDGGELFGNIAPMMELTSVLWRVSQFEVISSIGFGGFITFNESSLSVIPGMSATVGAQFTVDEDMVFRIEAGLDAGLWMWKTLSSKGFMMAIQKPVMFGVGVRV